jgi:hypothetical protein
LPKVTREFTVEELEEEYDLPYSGEELSFERIDKHRWYTVCEVVFKADDGLTYMVDYLDPATEMQDGQDRWPIDNYKNNSVNAVQVEPKEVTTTKWVPVVVSDRPKTL